MQKDSVYRTQATWLIVAAIAIPLSLLIDLFYGL